MDRHAVLLFIGPIVFLLLAVSSVLLFFSEMAYRPALAAWGLSSVNFIAAFWSMKKAQKAKPIHSMLWLFGGGGIRMLLMVAVVLWVVLKKASWMMDFCLVLLGCFVLYLILEIWMVYRQGQISQSLQL
jgi:hypothetical protein